MWGIEPTLSHLKGLVVLALNHLTICLMSIKGNHKTMVFDTNQPQVTIGEYDNWHVWVHPTGFNRSHLEPFDHMPD